MPYRVTIALPGEHPVDGRFTTNVDAHGRWYREFHYKQDAVAFQAEINAGHNLRTIVGPAKKTPAPPPKAIQWENVPHRAATTAQIADVQRIDSPKLVRLYVRRCESFPRKYVSFVDGKRFGPLFKSMDAAKEYVVQFARDQGMIETFTYIYKESTC